MVQHTHKLVGTALAASSLLIAPAAFAAPPTACAPGTCGVTTTALLVGGEGSYATLTEEQMTTAFGGYFKNYKNRISVPFPGDAPFEVSVPVGSDNLYNAIYAHQASDGGPLTIGGVSKGAASVVDVLYRLLEDYEDTNDAVTPPSKDSMNVAIYGAPGKVFFLSVKHQPIPDTPWDTLLVSGEYDGIADFPDNPFNVLALLNALEGAQSRHVDAAFYDVTSNPVYYKTVTNSYGAEVTYVVIPSERLPLLNDLYESDAWSPGAVAWLEKALRPVIDSAYKRHWPSQQDDWTYGIAPMPVPPNKPSASAEGESSLNEELSKAVQRKTFSDEDYVGKHRQKEDAQDALVDPEIEDETKEDADVEINEIADTEAESEDAASAESNETNDSDVSTPEAGNESSHGSEGAE